MRIQLNVSAPNVYFRAKTLKPRDDWQFDDKNQAHFIDVSGRDIRHQELSNAYKNWNNEWAQPMQPVVVVFDKYPSEDLNRIYEEICNDLRKAQNSDFSPSTKASNAYKNGNNEWVHPNPKYRY